MSMYLTHSRRNSLTSSRALENNNIFDTMNKLNLRLVEREPPHEAGQPVISVILL